MDEASELVNNVANPLLKEFRDAALVLEMAEHDMKEVIASILNHSGHENDDEEYMCECSYDRSQRGDYDVAFLINWEGLDMGQSLNELTVKKVCAFCAGRIDD